MGRSIVCVGALLLLTALPAGAQQAKTSYQRMKESIAAKNQAQTAARAEYQRQQQWAQSQRSWGNQDYYTGPKGQVVNGRDLPVDPYQKGYHYAGSRNLGQPQGWQRGSGGRNR